MKEHEELVEIEINFEFINQFSDEPTLVGYVNELEYSNDQDSASESIECQSSPNKTGLNQSGVIIGYNFNLGEHTVEDLRSYNVNPTLIGKLYPYLGRTGVQAHVYLQNFGLNITKNEAQALENGITMLALESIIARYENDSQTHFGDIPPVWQTVIASVASEHNNLASGYPRFWNMITKQSWKAALEMLRDFGDNNSKRRNLEADYIEQSA